MQIENAMERMLASEAGVEATLLWRVVTGRDPDAHPDDETAALAAVTTVTEGSLVFRALFHTVAPRTGGFQKFLEVQTGDVILDYRADLALAGKEDVRVVVGGRTFVQKQTSKELLETWDLQCEYGGMMKTLLLQPMK